MTEADWLTCTSPEKMLRHLGAKVSERKLRLFAVACCRRIWHLLNPEVSQRGVEVIERFADGQVTEEELAAVHDQARRYGEAAYRRSQRLHPRSPESDLAYRDSQQAYAVAHAAAPEADYIGMVLIDTTQCAAREIAGYRASYDEQAHEVWSKLVEADHTAQTVLLHDIFGNPFCSVRIDPSWLLWNDGTIPKIAQAIYDAGRFEDMPILGDALEDAGCDNQEILAHCRQPGGHVRGCWLLDLLLGKE